MTDADPKLEKIELVPIEEIAMGCESYGIRIETNFGVFENFANLPVVVGHGDYERCTELSSCSRYYRIKGAFTTWILDIQNQSISVYETTIRTEGNEWSEEQAIFGQQRHHISGFGRHYYLQFPFVGKNEFDNVYQDFTTFRIKQIGEATRAL
jgi:hypothetical protein